MRASLQVYEAQTERHKIMSFGSFLLPLSLSLSLSSHTEVLLALTGFYHKALHCQEARMTGCT